MTNAEVLGWIFGTGVVQGLFLIISLGMLPVRNTRARWFLVASLGVFTTMLVEEFFDVVGLPPGIGIGLVVEFAAGPLLYLFVISLAEDDPAPLRARWPHFLPLILAGLWFSYLKLGANGADVSLSNPQFRQLVALTVLVKVIYFAVYAVLILRRPLSLSAKPPASRRALSWVRRWMWFVCGAYFLTALSFLAFYLQISWAVDSDQVGGVAMVIAIYSLGYFALANRNVFDVSVRRTLVEIDRSGAGLARNAREYLEQSSLYLDPDFDLRTLADALRTSESRISKELNASIDGGFYSLVNDYRLDHFRRLVDDPASVNRTVLELAYDAGFSSKATFYRYFRAREGTTPKDYRARQRQLSNA